MNSLQHKLENENFSEVNVGLSTKKKNYLNNAKLFLFDYQLSTLI